MSMEEHFVERLEDFRPRVLAACEYLAAVARERLPSSKDIASAKELIEQEAGRLMLIRMNQELAARKAEPRKGVEQ